MAVRERGHALASRSLPSWLPVGVSNDASLAGNARRVGYGRSVCGDVGETPHRSTRFGIGQPSSTVALRGSSAAKVGSCGSVTVRGSRGKPIAVASPASSSNHSRVCRLTPGSTSSVVPVARDERDQLALELAPVEPALFRHDRDRCSAGGEDRVGER